MTRIVNGRADAEEVASDYDVLDDVLYQGIVRARQLHGVDGVFGIVSTNDGVLGYAGLNGDDCLVSAYPLCSTDTMYVHETPVYPDILQTTSTEVDATFKLSTTVSIPTTTFFMIEMGGERFTYALDEYSIPDSHQNRVIERIRPQSTIYKTCVSIDCRVTYCGTEYVVESFLNGKITLANPMETRRLARTQVLHHLLNTGDFIPPLRSEQPA